MPLDACVVLVTCGTKEEAEHIARTTVEEALAACVNVLGGGGLLRSFYIWEEKLQQDEEWLLIMKTFRDKLPALEARVRELHSYSVPEFIALPVEAGAQNYIQWMTQCLK